MQNLIWPRGRSEMTESIIRRERGDAASSITCNQPTVPHNSPLLRSYCSRVNGKEYSYSSPLLTLVLWYMRVPILTQIAVYGKKDKSGKEALSFFPSIIHLVRFLHFFEWRVSWFPVIMLMMIFFRWTFWLLICWSIRYITVYILWRISFAFFHNNILLFNTMYS